jgi:hypothetical protein
MDGKLVTGLGFLALPAAVIGVTVAWFSSNPVTIFAMIALMLVGAFYLMTYRETFG